MNDLVGTDDDEVDVLLPLLLGEDWGEGDLDCLAPDLVYFVHPLMNFLSLSKCQRHLETSRPSGREVFVYCYLFVIVSLARCLLF